MDVNEDVAEVDGVDVEVGLPPVVVDVVGSKPIDVVVSTPSEVVLAVTVVVVVASASIVELAPASESTPSPPLKRAIGTTTTKIASGTHVATRCQKGLCGSAPCDVTP